MDTDKYLEENNVIKVKSIKDYNIDKIIITKEEIPKKLGIEILYNDNEIIDGDKEKTITILYNKETWEKIKNKLITDFEAEIKEIDEETKNSTLLECTLIHDNKIFYFKRDIDKDLGLDDYYENSESIGAILDNSPDDLFLNLAIFELIPKFDNDIKKYVLKFKIKNALSDKQMDKFVILFKKVINRILSYPEKYEYNL